MFLIERRIARNDTSQCLCDSCATTLYLSTHGTWAPEKAKAERAEKAKTAEAILVAFGFSKTPAETTGASEKGDDSEKRVARFDKAKIGVVENGGSVNVLRGNTSLGKGGMSGGRFTGAAYLPDAKAVVITSYVPSDMCARTDEDVIAVKP